MRDDEKRQAVVGEMSKRQLSSDRVNEKIIRLANFSNEARQKTWPELKGLAIWTLQWCYSSTSSSCAPLSSLISFSSWDASFPSASSPSSPSSPPSTSSSSSFDFLPFGGFFNSRLASSFALSSSTSSSVQDPGPAARWYVSTVLQGTIGMSMCTHRKCRWEVDRAI